MKSTIIGNWVDSVTKEKIQIRRKSGDTYWMYFVNSTKKPIYFSWLIDGIRIQPSIGGHVPGVFNEDGTKAIDYSEDQYDLLLNSETYFLFCLKNGAFFKRFNFHSSDSLQNNFDFSRLIIHNVS